MHLYRLKCLREFEEVRPLRMSWWVFDSRGSHLGYTRVPENACATAGCHAGNTWLMAGCPVASEGDGDARTIAGWAAEFLELSQAETEFLFDGQSHREPLLECSRREALARLDYLLTNGRRPPEGESNVMPYLEWARVAVPSLADWEAERR